MLAKPSQSQGIVGTGRELWKFSDSSLCSEQDRVERAVFLGVEYGQG